MNIEQKLVAPVVGRLKALYGQDVPTVQVQSQKTEKELERHLTLVVFPFLQMSKKGPEQTVQEIGEYLQANEPSTSTFNVIRGFLNLAIVFSTQIELLNSTYAGARHGVVFATDKSPLVMIECSSPNTSKPLHPDRVRSNLPGNVLVSIIAANGSKVIKTNIVNNHGIHICKSMLAWLKYGNGETPETSGKKSDYLVGDYYVTLGKHYKAEAKELMAKSQGEGLSGEEAKARAGSESPLMKEAREMLMGWETNGPEVRTLQKKMNDWVHVGLGEIYHMTGATFDKIYCKSETCLEGKEKVMEGLEKGLFYHKEDGSVWTDLTGGGLDHKLLLRIDGISVYMTQDIGTAKLRFANFPTDRTIYVVGSEQNYHFQVLSILPDKLGFDWRKGLVRFSYGMVELPEGEMKNREGTAVDAGDSMAETINIAKETLGELGKLDGPTQEEADNTAHIVGLGTLKYFILKVDARKGMTLNPKESIDFGGNTGSFIQYTHARIQSVLRKAKEVGIAIPAQLPSGTELSEKEEGLIQMITDLVTAVKQVGEDYSFSLIANYTYDLAKRYNQFYHDFSILREENEVVRTFRLALSENVAKVVRLGMGLLGIEVPDRT